MIISLEKEEYITLAYHLNIMKKAIKKALKKNYGRSFKKHYSVFNSAANTIKNAFDPDKEDYYHLSFEENEVQSIYDFLNSYITALAQEDLGEEQKEQLDLLETIKGHFNFKLEVV